MIVNAIIKTFVTLLLTAGVLWNVWLFQQMGKQDTQWEETSAILYESFDAEFFAYAARTEREWELRDLEEMTQELIEDEFQDDN